LRSVLNKRLYTIRPQRYEIILNQQTIELKKGSWDINQVAKALKALGDIIKPCKKGFMQQKSQDCSWDSCASGWA
jgi:hypothetical protein